MQNFDLIVAGAGFSGCAAALSAARSGLSVLLIDRANAPGGAAVTNLVNPFMRYHTTHPETGERVDLSAGIFKEIVDEMRAMNGLGTDTQRRFREEYLKLVLTRMLQKAGVHFLLDATLSDAGKEGSRITSVEVVTKEGKMTLSAPYFIDATGDGDLCARAGLPFTLGREKDNRCQPMTLCFRLSGVDTEEYIRIRPQIQEAWKEKLEKGELLNPRENVLSFLMPQEGILHLNSTRVVKLDPTDPWERTQAELIAREQTFELFEFLKGYPCFEKAELIMSAQEIGVRESRKILGEYTLTREDLVACTKFPDGIARGNYDIDIHSPDGCGTSHYYFEPGTYYTIPYRTLTPKGMDNLLVAGRCLSATHEAQASTRIMPICCCLGEAAGLAVAQAKKKGIGTRDVDTDALRVALGLNEEF